MSTLIHRCIIVPDALATMAGQLTAAASPAGGGMFLQGLGVFGDDTITHRFSAGLVSAQFAALMPLDEWDEETGAYVRVSPGMPLQIAAMGNDPEALYLLNPTAEPAEGEEAPAQPEPGLIPVVEALLVGAVVTTDDWQVAAGRLGLQRVE